MSTQEDAAKILKYMGEQFGVPDIAQEAIGDLPFWIGKGDDPIIVGWEIFLELLDMYEATEKAFENGIHKQGFVPFLVKSLSVEDAEDVSQIALYGAWCSFRSFKPYRISSWKAWLLMIAQRKLDTFLAKLYEELEVIAYLSEGIIIDDRVEIFPKEEEEKHAEVRVVAERWICGGHEGKATFAARVLAMKHNEDRYIGLSGSHMEREVGVSRQTLSKWTKQFIEEVHIESKG